MTKTLYKFCMINTFAILSCSFSHADSLSKAELDLLIKEDIATAQVLTEICPPLIGDATQVLHHVDTFTQSNLKRLSNPATTLTDLKQDSEYQMAYKEAKNDSLSTDQAEQRQGCEDILHMHSH